MKEKQHVSDRRITAVLQTAGTVCECVCVTAQLEAGLVQRRAALFQTNSSRKLKSVGNS